MRLMYNNSSVQADIEGSGVYPGVGSRDPGSPLFCHVKLMALQSFSNFNENSAVTTLHF